MSDLTQPKKRRAGMALVPLLVFLVLGGVLLYALESGTDPQSLPSALQGKPAPATQLPPLEGAVLADGSPVPGISYPAGGTGRLLLVNVFASWCAPCRLEHPLLMQLSADERFDLLGINQKDRPEQALSFLRELSNPYDAIGADENGRASIDWGVYGVPETFLVSPEGVVVWKMTGPLTPQVIEAELLPLVAQHTAR
ncbi:DsbE family thiol:disulfide interchange protein [Aureimonas fodinaquatilis]|uniref:DsbE family thiol:disulfide interchange protein n=1 Tax=Aureimonas fodinaquatilis TaxID=2565783 RepID=A0A5B0DVX7_9HYPH|nr:DsbE family thiol:disulfide interchange protein [Aureimonas fodinaquatilis]KAA0969720.1 DsbE family thiol:disulfide interchange protein [Aureimonas fodinaquatilis]